MRGRLWQQAAGGGAAQEREMGEGLGEIMRIKFYKLTRLKAWGGDGILIALILEADLCARIWCLVVVAENALKIQFILF